MRWLSLINTALSLAPSYGLLASEDGEVVSVFLKKDNYQQLFCPFPPKALYCRIAKSEWRILSGPNARCALFHYLAARPVMEMPPGLIKWARWLHGLNAAGHRRRPKRLEATCERPDAKIARVFSRDSHFSRNQSSFFRGPLRQRYPISVTKHRDDVQGTPKASQTRLKSLQSDRWEEVGSYWKSDLTCSHDLHYRRYLLGWNRIVTENEANDTLIDEWELKSYTVLN